MSSNNVELITSLTDIELIIGLINIELNNIELTMSLTDIELIINLNNKLDQY